MPATPDPPNLDELPPALPEVRANRAVWLVWLVPVLAVVISAGIGISTALERGPKVLIHFRSAEGLEAGKTKIRYKDVEIGEVTNINLDPGYARVLVTAELQKSLAPMLVADTRFWIVRPRIAAGGVSGLGTLLSGAYIGVDVGHSGAARNEFDGLEVPPVVTQDFPGRQFTLHGHDLGSLDIGAPVYYRRLPVGQVTAYDLDADGRGVTFKIFVNAPYDRFVSAETRFWHASGFDVTVDANGLRLETQSLSSIVLGGVAFETPNAPAGTPAASEAPVNTVFALAQNHQEALRHPDTAGRDFLLLVKGSVRGLSIGAPVEFRGVGLGEVTDIRVDFQGPDKDVDMAVFIRLYPDRLRSLYRTPPPDSSADRERLVVSGMVARGFRAQLRSGNLLTGQLYVALDFFPKAPKAAVDWGKQPPEFPLVPGTFDALQEAVVNIAGKLERLPLDSMAAKLDHTLAELDQAVAHADALVQSAGSSVVPQAAATLQDLDQALRHTDHLVQQIDSDVAPELASTLRESHRALDNASAALQAASGTLGNDSPLQDGARKALAEITATARTLHGLADYLERHPEALLRGKPKDTP